MFKKILFFCLSIILISSSNIKANTLDSANSNLFNNKSKTVQVLSHSKGKTYITNKDINLMSRVVYGESRGEPYEGKVAVASTILNRVKHPAFPQSVEGVIKQRNAFSCVIKGKIKNKTNEDCYRAVLDALKGNDPTNRCVFFYNPKISTSSWMKKIDKKNIKTIGNHVFFVIN